MCTLQYTNYLRTTHLFLSTKFKQRTELFWQFSPAFYSHSANDIKPGHTYRSRVSSVKPAAVSAI